ncbi:MAG TPA: EamA family transporter [Gaiellaceae bacterium]
MPRHRAVGYGMVALAATLFAINGTVSKVILGSGVNAQQLTEVRCAGALVGLMLIALATRPAALPLSRSELPLILALGVVGLALVQWSYFFAIHRVPIGVALVVQFVGPILVALWTRFVYGEHVRARIWIALVLAITGLVLIVELWQTNRPNGAGLAAAALAAVTYAAYILLAERGVRHRDPISLSAWGFFFATLFWSLVAPWWNFPSGRVGSDVSLLGILASRHLPVWGLMLWMIVLGTIVPFALVVGALRRISATRVGITAMLEPVVAIAIAWAWLGESLNPVQISGAAVTLAGVALALSSR